MNSCIRQQLSTYQRRSLRTIETMMGICIALSILLLAILERHNLSMPMRYAIALLAVAPIVPTILLITRYLRGEKDEYMRNLVVESMLWGLSCVLIADTFVNYIGPLSFFVGIGNISLDVFAITTSAALEIKLRGNQ
jgi:hypothetical protein